MMPGASSSSPKPLNPKPRNSRHAAASLDPLLDRWRGRQSPSPNDRTHVLKVPPKSASIKRQKKLARGIGGKEPPSSSPLIAVRKCRVSMRAGKSRIRARSINLGLIWNSRAPSQYREYMGGYTGICGVEGSQKVSQGAPEQQTHHPMKTSHRLLGRGILPQTNMKPGLLPGDNIKPHTISSLRLKDIKNVKKTKTRRSHERFCETGCDVCTAFSMHTEIHRSRNPKTEAPILNLFFHPLATITLRSNV